MTRSAVRISVALATAVVAVTAGGCWSSPDDDPPRRTGDPVAGTTLQFGESATVPLGDGEASVRVTVTELERGDPADLRQYLRENAEPDEEPVLGDPYYVRYELTSSSESARTINVTRLITARAGDRLVRHLTLTHPFAPCQEELWPFADAGGGETTVTGCSIWLSDPDGAEVDTVAANGQDADEPVRVQWRQ